MQSFRREIEERTRPLNGQYPRPWMTRSPQPERARVFVVGRNQATGYPENVVPSHEAYVDALFNRAGQSCRALYDAVRTRSGEGPSPTRTNLDWLTTALEDAGVQDVLETNVVCYSTPMSADLARAEHRGGREQGTAIFRFLLETIRPLVLIAHGSGTHKNLVRMLGSSVPEPPAALRDGVCAMRVRARAGDRPYEPLVIAIPSLAPPAYNRWSSWAHAHLQAVATRVAEELRHER